MIVLKMVWEVSFEGGCLGEVVLEGSGKLPGTAGCEEGRLGEFVVQVCCWLFKVRTNYRGSLRSELTILIVQVCCWFFKVRTN